ncbi:MAG: tungsten-containing formylmethanofuran dehydrogenase 2 subunit C [Planctomycetaceae bacterium]|nr:MAG: tungsten-containing formylmethanofuran dehydrogenase 2 subunit C [Planctomycetaceae bacterium]
MALTLTYTGHTQVPVEVEGLTPTWCAGKSLAEIERFEIFLGNRKVPLAELFTVRGDPDDLTQIWQGDLRGVHWIGAHLEGGHLVIEGSAGRHVGSQMRSGTIVVQGDADGWAGAEMRGGLLRIQGNAGHLAGAAYRGSPKGMRGGTLLIEGNAGNEVGLAMRRGLIAIQGHVEDMLGFHMIAGTIVVCGNCGVRPGAGMKRGTLALWGTQPPTLLPTFRYALTTQLVVMRLLLAHLEQLQFPFDPQLWHAPSRIYHGDLVELGKGEIWLRDQA